VESKDEDIILSAENWATIHTDRNEFLPTLRRMVYDIDAAIADGQYQQTPLKPCYIFEDDRPPPPAHMDIPVWDEERKRWWDAEY